MKYNKKLKWDFPLSNNCKIRANEDKEDSDAIKESAETIPQVRDDEGPDVEEIDEGHDEHSMGNVYSFTVIYNNNKKIIMSKHWKL